VLVKAVLVMKPLIVVLFSWSCVANRLVISTMDPSGFLSAMELARRSMLLVRFKKL
jgi:hypothetical protein